MALYKAKKMGVTKKKADAARKKPMPKPGLAKRKSARKAYAKAVKTSKPGKGKRFAALEKSIAASGNAKDAGAIAASIGRKRYGPKKFAAMGAAGRKRAARGR